MIGDIIIAFTGIVAITFFIYKFFIQEDKDSDSDFGVLVVIIIIVILFLIKAIGLGQF